MATHRPLVVVGGAVQQIPAGDTLDASLVPAQSGALIDGGAPSTVHTGNLRVDFGSPT